MSESKNNPSRARSVGLIGFGDVGQFLCAQMLGDRDVRRKLDLAFVYNRTASRLRNGGLPSRYRLVGPDAGAAVASWLVDHGAPDLIVEVSHPEHVARCGAGFLDSCDFFAASISALADADVSTRLTRAAWGNAGGHGLYLPVGAAWGVQDIVRMNQHGTLTGLTISMTFHTDSLRLLEPLAGRLEDYRRDDKQTDACVLFEGSVAELAPLAPNNVNTMTCIALAGASVGLKGTRARLIAQKQDHAHTVEIEVAGRDGFLVRTHRYNPSRPGAVTGLQTYHSFLASLLSAGGEGNGVHFC